MEDVETRATQLESGSATSFKEVTIISGKGGTGKTTLTACFAQLAEDKVMTDNDVDAADLHLLLRPSVLEAHDFVGGVTATIDPEVCTGCGVCASICPSGAIQAEKAV